MIRTKNKRPEVRKKNSVVMLDTSYFNLPKTLTEIRFYFYYIRGCLQLTEDSVNDF